MKLGQMYSLYLYQNAVINLKNIKKKKEKQWQQANCAHATIHLTYKK